MVIAGGGVWDVFCETLVILGGVVEVVFVETPGVVTLDVVGFRVVPVPFFEAEETGDVGFAVSFEVVTVTEETGVAGGFTVLLEDSFLRLTGTLRVFPAKIPRNVTTGAMTWGIKIPLHCDFHGHT